MATVHAYLNFDGNCNEAFDFYQKVFKTERLSAQFYDDMPADPSHPPMPDDAKGKIMHTAIKIGDGTLIMGSDVVEGFGHHLTVGNSAYIMLNADSASEAQELFTNLSVGSPEVEMALGETFFAELYSSFQDRFGVWWIIHFEGNKKMA